MEILPSPVYAPPGRRFATAEVATVGGTGAAYRVDLWWGRTEEPDGALVAYLRATWLTLRQVGRLEGDWVVFRASPVGEDTGEGADLRELWDGASITIRDLEELL